MPGKTSRDIIVTIIYDSRGGVCEGRCGLDWTTPDTLKLVREQIKEKYPGVEVTFQDIGQQLKPGPNETGEKYPQLLINGQLRISGLFTIRSLLDAIEIDMEIGGGERDGQGKL